MKKIVASIILSLVLTGCGTPGLTARPDLQFKQITPEMDIRMANLRKQGCTGGTPILDKDVAWAYSIIPGGGQFYTGESEKGIYYLFGSALIVPYFVAFQDAQNSVDFYNFQHDIEYCTEKLRLARQLGQQTGKADVPE